MHDALRLALALAAGLVIGAIFFGGLWWTVHHGIRRERPALWFVGSLLLRVAIALGGFYLVGREHWQPLVPCLIGFITARLAITRLMHEPPSARSAAIAEVHGAP